MATSLYLREESRQVGLPPVLRGFPEAGAEAVRMLRSSDGGGGEGESPSKMFPMALLIADPAADTVSAAVPARYLLLAGKSECKDWEPSDLNLAGSHQGTLLEMLPHRRGKCDYDQ